MKARKAAKPVGRPRGFDTDKALDAALRVFWRKGYEGASLSDLTNDMRINRPSLYAAFGDKEALFRKALDRYTQGPMSYVWKALNEPAAHTVAECLLNNAVDSLTAPHYPRGCLLVQGALACGESAGAIRQELISRRAAGEARLRERLKRAKSEGDLPPDSNPADLARYLMTVIQGMSVQAAGGATRGELRRTVKIALQTFPKSRGARESDIYLGR